MWNLIITITVILLILIAFNYMQGCVAPIEPDTEFITKEGVLGDCKTINYFQGTQFYPGWIIDAGMDLRRTTYSLFVARADGTFTEPMNQVMVTEIFVFRLQGLTDETKYTLNIVKKK